MNSNKFVYSVIAVLISVVFIGSCLAPVVMDAVTGDKQTITLSNDDTGATTFVYKLAAADSIIGNISTGEYTITAGGTDYTTTTDPLLINPDEGIIAPDIQNKYITVYGANGIEQQILVTEATQVTCSYSTTWFVASNGKVYGCGANSNGQQGSGTSGSGTNVTTFTDRTPEGKTVTQVACSQYTTWFMTQDGKVYGCGQGNSGQQGSGNTTDVKTFTDRTPESPNTFTIDNKADYYLITDAADIPNQYLYITDASTGYYADPSEAVVFTYGADSYFVSVGATAGSHYGTLPTLATVNGTDTQLSPGYRVYQYSDSFPVTADGASTGLAGFVELEYQGEVGQGGLDPTFGTLLVLTVTFAIIGVVLAAVRMIGGRE